MNASYSITLKITEANLTDSYTFDKDYSIINKSQISEGLYKPSTIKLKLLPLSSKVTATNFNKFSFILVKSNTTVKLTVGTNVITGTELTIHNPSQFTETQFTLQNLSNTEISYVDVVLIGEL